MNGGTDFDLSKIEGRAGATVEFKELASLAQPVTHNFYVKDGDTLNKLNEAVVANFEGHTFTFEMSGAGYVFVFEI